MNQVYLETLVQVPLPQRMQLQTTLPIIKIGKRFLSFLKSLIHKLNIAFAF